MRINNLIPENTEGFGGEKPPSEQISTSNAIKNKKGDRSLPKINSPKFDALLAVFPVFQSFAIFICGAVYYKLFSILIFLKGIFLYFSRS